MGDDLVDDWWVKEDVLSEKEMVADEKNIMNNNKKNVKETGVENKEMKKSKKMEVKDPNVDQIENKSGKSRKRKSKQKTEGDTGHVDIDIDSAGKKKKKRKDSKIKEYVPTCESMWNFFEEELKKTLTTMEIEDLKPDSDDWFLEETEKFSRDKLEHFSPFLMNVASSWKNRCSLLTKKSIKGSPAMLILTSSAVRAVDLLRNASSFKGDHKSVKLFAKHFKISEQVKLLNENVVHLSVGTPHRILALVETGSLKIEELKYLIIDWSWKDVKMRQIFNMPHVKEDFLVLFQKHFFELCKRGTLSVGLF